MVIFDALQNAAKRLRPKRINCPPDQNVGWLEAEILMAHTLGREKSWIMAHANRALTPAETRAFERCVRARLAHKPIAYILGYQEFYGRRFLVNRYTLIPRPESELFIDILMQEPPKDTVIWDVGTGCGAIGITAAREFPSVHVIASDRSRRALRMAGDNAFAHGVDGRVMFLRGNLLSRTIVTAIERANKTLMVLANLPYLPESDRKKLQPDVVAFEPRRALFAKDKGMALNKTLLTNLRERLHTVPERILLEFDPPQSRDLKRFASSLFPEAMIGVHNDLAGRNRILDIRFGT